LFNNFLVSEMNAVKGADSYYSIAQLGKF